MLTRNPIWPLLLTAQACYIHAPLVVGHATSFFRDQYPFPVINASVEQPTGLLSNHFRQHHPVAMETYREVTVSMTHTGVVCRRRVRLFVIRSIIVGIAATAAWEVNIDVWPDCMALHTSSALVESLSTT